MPEPEKIVPTTCASHCGGTCVLKAHIRDQRIVRFETDSGTEPQMRACAKGRAYRQRVYSPDRLVYPLKRVGPRGSGEFKRISWDEALDTVAGELKRITGKYGPESIVLVFSGGDLGQVHTSRQITQLLCKAGGYSRSWGAASFQGAVAAISATYGDHFTSSSRDDLPNSKLILMWGWDPAATIAGTNTSWFLAQAKEAGARIVAVDPRFTDSAATFADEWIPVRPGTDAAMLIAMAFVVITKNLQDQSFLDKYTSGFDHFRRYVLGEEDGVPKTPAWAEAITGVPSATIEKLARDYATIRPAALLAGIAPGRSAFGEQYHRAAITLAAMTGNIGVHGGDAAGRSWGSLSWYPYRMPGAARAGDTPNPVEAPGGGIRTRRGIIYTTAWSGLSQVRAGTAVESTWLHKDLIADCILKGTKGGYPVDLKMLFVVNSNYVNQCSNTRKIERAMKRLECIVVQEQFMTPTARLADVILPTSTYLERNDVARGVGTPFYGAVNKVVEPAGECKSQTEIAVALAERLGIDLTHESDEELARKEIEGSEITDYDQFRRNGIYKIKLDEPYVGFNNHIQDISKHPFPTPSGKIEVYASQWAKKNDPLLPPVPSYIETWESRNDPLSRKYPIQLIGTHFKLRALSQFHRIPWLAELKDHELLMNRKDAEARNIKNGDMVQVFNGRGRITVRVRVSERVMPGVADLPIGAWYQPDAEGIDRGGCMNILTLDRVSPAGSFSFNTCLVQIQRL